MEPLGSASPSLRVPPTDHGSSLGTTTDSSPRALRPNATRFQGASTRASAGNECKKSRTGTRRFRFSSVLPGPRLEIYSSLARLLGQPTDCPTSPAPARQPSTHTPTSGQTSSITPTLTDNLASTSTKPNMSTPAPANGTAPTTAGRRPTRSRSSKASINYNDDISDTEPEEDAYATVPSTKRGTGRGARAPSVTSEGSSRASVSTR